MDDLKRGKDSDERYDALREIFEYGNDAAGPLIVALEDKDPYVRGFAAFGLGKVGDEKAVASLIQHLQDEEIFDFGTVSQPLYVAQSVAEALGELKAQSAVPHLQRALSKARSELKLTKERHDEITHPAKYVATSHFVEGLVGALNKLAKARGDKTDAVVEALPAKIEKLIDQLGERDQRYEAQDELVKIGEPAIPYLAKALKNEDKLIRWYSIRTLEAIGGKKAIETLKVALNDEDPLFRTSAKGAIEELESSSPRSSTGATSPLGEGESERQKSK